MDNKTFENYQKRMIDAMKNPNPQSNDLFTKLANILDNLNKFINSGSFSFAGFKQEVENQFQSVDHSDETARHFRCTLMRCTNKTDALKTISELYAMVKPLSLQVGSWSSVASIAKECIADIQKSIYHR